MARSAALGIVVGLLITPTPTNCQQTAGWIHSQDNDALHGKLNEKFLLEGKYLTPPEHAHEAAPSIVVVCSDGKVKQNYLNVGAVITMEGHSDLVAALEARIDGKKKSILYTGESTDGTSVFFTRVDLRNILRSHQVIVGINEHLGPEVVMQFDMPDPSPIFAACGKDRIVKEK